VRCVRIFFEDGEGIFISGVLILVWVYKLGSSVVGSSTGSGCVGGVEVWGLTLILLQLLEVWPVGLQRKQVILSSVKNILYSV